MRMRGDNMRCAKCGAPGCCVDMQGTVLCRRCLSESIKGRVVRWIRKASPRPRDDLILAVRNDLQSTAAVKLVYAVERAFDVTIQVLEIGDQPTLEELVGALHFNYTFVDADYNTYTEFRLRVLEHLPPRFSDPLVVLPDALEDLVAYALGEVFLGKLRGLTLDAAFRVAYPLAAVSLREIAQAFPARLSNAPKLYSLSSARKIVEWALLSSPTLCNSTVQSLLNVASAIKSREKYKTP